MTFMGPSSFVANFSLEDGSGREEEVMTGVGVGIRFGIRR